MNCLCKRCHNIIVATMLVILIIIFDVSVNCFIDKQWYIVCFKVAFVAVDLRIDCFQNQGGTVQYVLKLHLICSLGL